MQRKRSRLTAWTSFCRASTAIRGGNQNRRIHHFQRSLRRTCWIPDARRVRGHEHESAMTALEVAPTHAHTLATGPNLFESTISEKSTRRCCKPNVFSPLRPSGPACPTNVGTISRNTPTGWPFQLETAQASGPPRSRGTSNPGGKRPQSPDTGNTVHKAQISGPVKRRGARRHATWKVDSRRPSQLSEERCTVYRYSSGNTLAFLHKTPMTYSEDFPFMASLSTEISIHPSLMPSFEA